MYVIMLDSKKLFVHISIILLFAFLYYISDKQYKDDEDIVSFEIKQTNIIDYIYHSLIVHSTIGFGDNTPKTNLSVILHSIHAFILIILSIA